MKIIIESIMLLLLSIQDIRKKRISITLLVLWGTMEIILQVLVYHISVTAFLCGLIPGFLCLFVSKVTHEAIGYGDGFVLLILGVAMGIKSTILVLLIGCFLLFFLSIYFITVKKVSRKKTIAFIPFLTAGYVLLLL